MALHFVSLLLILITSEVMHVSAKSLSLSENSSFQDLSPARVDQDVKALRTGQAPIKVSSPHSKLNGNILWGFEKKWVELRCHVNASPVAEFVWKYRGMSINPEAAHADTLVISGEDNVSILKVKVQESSLGEFTCRASNELGAAETNFFLRRAAKPLTPEFSTVVVPDSGILVEITGVHSLHRRHLHVLQTRNFKDRSELGEILPIKGYIVQLRKMRSCDQWRNITMNSKKKFLRHHLLPGTIYRMRIAARTEAGIGEFSRAESVNYRLPEPISDSEEGVDQTTTSSTDNYDDAVSSMSSESL